MPDIFLKSGAANPNDVTLSDPTTGSASSTLYTLTADAGSFAVTGADATLKAQRVIGAASAVFIETGSDASLVAKRAMPASSGSFVETGTAATLRVSRAVTANAGSIAQSGSAAALSADRVLVASPGAYSATGTAAALSVHRIATATPGAVAWSGSDASQVAKRELAADGGSFDWTGTDADLVYTQGAGVNVTLVCESGSFVWTGSDLEFIATITPQAPVTVALGGAFYVVEPRASRAEIHLECEAGHVTWRGTTAELRVIRGRQAAAGRSDVVGTDARLSVSYALVAERCEVSAIGHPAVLRSSLRASRSPGTVKFKGVDAELRALIWKPFTVGGEKQFTAGDVKAWRVK
jgi:hypothetical protein